MQPSASSRNRRSESGFNPHRPFRAGATPGIVTLYHDEARVSILTGPFGPVQQGDGLVAVVRAVLFQSSPALSGRCNFTLTARWGVNYKFQSSPALSGRCNDSWMSAILTEFAFQSSPALSGRCNPPESSPRYRRANVSILPGPFGPVQRARVRP